MDSSCAFVQPFVGINIALEGIRVSEPYVHEPCDFQCSMLLSLPTIIVFCLRRESGETCVRCYVEETVATG